jgi:hypothetical protein
LVEGLVSGADAGVSELCTCGGGCGGHASSVYQKSQNNKYCDEFFEASFATSRTGTIDRA